MSRSLALILCLCAVLWVCTALAPSGARAAGEKELSFVGGGLLDSETLATTNCWQLEYLQSVGEHKAASFSWLNDGHLDNHHRDGPCAQYWLRTKTLRGRLTLGAGLGPYYYFDTTRKNHDGPYSDEHGFGAVFSLDAGYRVDDRWMLHLRSNFTKARESFDTDTLALGIGYLIEPSGASHRVSPAAAKPGPWAKREEIDLLGGRTIVNSFESEKSIASCIEYRRSLTRYTDWSLGLLNEGDPRVTRRTGLVSELWGTRRFADGLWSLGVGAGAYLAIDKRRADVPRPGSPFLAGIVTMSATRRISRLWQARLSWSRIVTGYDRDADVLLFGAGYSLGGTHF